MCKYELLSPFMETEIEYGCKGYGIANSEYDIKGEDISQNAVYYGG